MPTYSIGQAARLLGVSPETVRRWADGGRLPMGRGSSENRVIDGAGLARFAKERAAGDVRGVPDEVPPTSVRNAFTGIVTALKPVRNPGEQRIHPRGPGRPHLTPPDLRPGTGASSAARRDRQELGTEAHSEYGHACLQRAPQQGQLRRTAGKVLVGDQRPAHIAKEAVTDLGLAAGSSVVALIKSTEVSLAGA